MKKHLQTVRNAWARVTSPIRHEVHVMRLMIEREDAE